MTTPHSTFALGVRCSVDSDLLLATKVGSFHTLSDSICDCRIMALFVTSLCFVFEIARDYHVITNEFVLKNVGKPGVELWLEFLYSFTKANFR